MVALAMSGCTSSNPPPASTSKLSSEPSQSTSTPDIDRVIPTAVPVERTTILTEETIPPAIVPNNILNENFVFNTSRIPDGSISAQLLSPSKDSYSIYRNGNNKEVGLQDKWYHMINIIQGNGDVTSALLSFDPGNELVDVVWSDSITSTDNLWYNQFVSNQVPLFKMDGKQLLFLESDITKEGGQYHLSVFNSETETINRVREDIWPLADDYDYIYQYRLDDKSKKLFLQSFLGNIWIFDLKNGDDRIYLQKYRVIPHSTSGYPSLFFSPAFDRFVHDDESGYITFYNAEGMSLRDFKLPEQQYVASQKIKWSPDGTVAWMESSNADSNRIKSVDIDLLIIAPTRIDFFNRDGRPIGTLKVEGSSGRSVEVVGWLNSEVAIIKEYTFVKSELDQVNGNLSFEKMEKDVTNYLFDIPAQKKRSMPDSINTNDAPLDSEEAVLQIVVENHAIIYKFAASSELK